MKENKIITIDVDFTKNRRELMKQLFITQKMLNNLKPCFARISSSKRGLHVLKFFAGEKIYNDNYIFIISFATVLSGQKKSTMMKKEN